MSFGICYAHLAVRYSKESLSQVILGEDFRYDHFALLELAGESNVTMAHPTSGREVLSRRWSLLAFGDSMDIVRCACEVAGYCEGGGTRLAGQRHTTPEGYIRRIRRALKEAADLDLVRRAGFTLSVELRLDPEEERFCKCPRAIQQLTAFGSPRKDGNFLVWNLQVLDSMGSACMLFLRGRLDERRLWARARAEGPRFQLPHWVVS